MQLVNQEHVPPESHSQQHATTFAHGHEAIEVVYVCLNVLLYMKKLLDIVQNNLIIILNTDHI